MDTDVDGDMVMDTDTDMEMDIDKDMDMNTLHGHDDPSQTADSVQLFAAVELEDFLKPALSHHLTGQR
jgi:hypothetical protein